MNNPIVTVTSCFITIIIFRENIKLIQCISLYPLVLWGFGGSSSSWDLQAPRSPATSGNCACVIPRRDHARSFNIIGPASSGSPSFATRKSIYYLLCCSHVGHLCHMAVPAQLRSFYAE